jgi:uncharacterized membrane protein
MWSTKKSTSFNEIIERVKTLEHEKQVLLNKIEQMKYFHKREIEIYKQQYSEFVKRYDKLEEKYDKKFERALDAPIQSNKETHNQHISIAVNNEKSNTTSITDSTLNNNGVTNFGETNRDVTQHQS